MRARLYNWRDIEASAEVIPPRFTLRSRKVKVALGADGRRTLTVVVPGDTEV
jgi:hypothetical protein